MLVPAYFDPVCERPDGLVWPLKVGRDSTSPTWKVANGPGYERLGSSYYVEQPRPTCVEQRIIEAAARLGPTTFRGCVTGWAGLRWHGASYFDGGGAYGGEVLPVPINLPSRGLLPRPGVEITHRIMSSTEREVVDGLPVATVQRCLFDEIVRLDDLWGAVQAIDMAAAAGLISVLLFATYVGECNSRLGAPLAREAVSLAVDEARSGRESWSRLVWRLVAGLAEPLVNQPVYALNGPLIGVPDLLDPVSGTSVEYQGVHHKEIGQHHDDVVRGELFRHHGIEVVEFVRGDSRDEAARRLLQARARAKFLPAGQRSWTLDPPPGTPVVETLDQRLERLDLVHALTHQ